MPAFVQAKGHQLVLNGEPFVFAGANCYYLVQRLVCESTSHEVIEVLDAARSLGLSVIRTWAFNDGDSWNSMQPAAGAFQEPMLEALDRLLAECSRRGLYLLPTLTNYWPEYGGMRQYARWSCHNDEATSEHFYNDEAAQKLYRDFLAAVVTRTNTVTGVAYRDDPTILAWDIANEPRCNNDFTAKTIAVWVDATAKYVKQLDPNHLVTFGCEGFFGPSDKDCVACNPYDAAHEGADFIAEFASPALDFACIHMWHNQWMPEADPAARVAAGERWVAEHERVCREVLRKPLVVEEFGCKENGGERVALFEMVYKKVADSAAASGALAGSCMWMLAARSYPDYDGYTLHLPSAASGDAASSGAAAQGGAPSAGDTMQVFDAAKRHVQRLQAARPIAA